MDTRLRKDERKLFGEQRATVNHCSISTIQPNGLSLIIQANAGPPNAQLNRDLLRLMSSSEPHASKCPSTFKATTLPQYIIGSVVSKPFRSEVQGGPKRKPVYYFNNFVYCQQTFVSYARILYM